MAASGANRAGSRMLSFSPQNGKVLSGLVPLHGAYATDLSISFSWLVVPLLKELEIKSMFVLPVGNQAWLRLHLTEKAFGGPIKEKQKNQKKKKRAYWDRF